MGEPKRGCYKINVVVNRGNEIKELYCQGVTPRLLVKGSIIISIGDVL